MSKASSVNRILTILKRLNEGKKVNLTNLSYEFDVSERTVYRDFDLISEVFTDFLKNDGKTYYGIKKDILNNILKGSDLASLISVLNVLNISGAKFEMDEHLKKLLKDSNNIYNLFNKPFEDLKKTSVIEKLERAIKYRQMIKVQYQTFNGVKEFELKPYKMNSLNENMYLISAIDTSEEYRISRIGMIVDVDVLTKTFYHDPEIMKFANTMQTPMARFKRNKKPLTIVVKVEQKISKYFKMKKYLPSQKILKENNDGSLFLEYTVTSLAETDDVFVKWHPKMQVLKPLFVRNYIKDLIESKMDGFNKNIEEDLVELNNFFNKETIQ